MAGRAYELPDEFLEAAAHVGNECERTFRENVEEVEPVYRAAQGESPQ